MGSATILAGNTYVDVLHGLSFTPTIDEIVLTPQDDLAGRTFWPSNPASTTFRINISMIDPDVDHAFTYQIIVSPGPTSPTGNAARVRLRLGLTVEDISDVDVEVFIGEAAAWLSDQIRVTLDMEDCSEAEANAIANLAAIYCYCKITGVSSTGWTANLGQLSFSGPAEKVVQLEFLKKQIYDFIQQRKAVLAESAEVPFVVGQA